MSDTNKQINNITVITQPGPCFYTINARVPMIRNETGLPLVKKIVKGYLSITGDPYDHYLGYSESGELLFSINCMVPCIVEYIVKKDKDSE